MKTNNPTPLSSDNRTDEMSKVSIVEELLPETVDCACANWEPIHLGKDEEEEVAHQIATMYLQQHPRPVKYAVHLCSTEDDSDGIYYHTLSEEEQAIIRKWEADEDGEGLELDEFLETENHHELLLRLVENNSLFPLNWVQGCDLNDTLQFTRFSLRLLMDDGTLEKPGYIGVPLTDDEFLELLEQCLLHANRLSMNMLVYKKPELSQRIISHMLRVYLDGMYECHNPTIIELDELKSVARSILDPSTDILHLSGSDDPRIRTFLENHEITQK